MDPAPSPPARAVPLVLTGDAELRTDLLRLCAAAGVTPDLTQDGGPDWSDGPGSVRRRWRSASCVLVGGDVATALAAEGLPRREDVVLVSRQAETSLLWKAAVTLGAAKVVTLPEGQNWLVPWLSDMAEGGRAALVIGVVGARGGAGASTFASALAVRAARRRRACLIDTDPLGGGVELVLGSEDCEGLRWADVAVTHGHVGAAAFRAALPEHREVTVLSWGRGPASPVSAATMRTMLVAAGRSFDVVVIDLPRQPDVAAVEALTACDHLLVVATTDVRSVAAASVLPAVEAGHDVRLVVRTGGAVGPVPESMAASLGITLAGVVPTRRSLARTIDIGLGPPRRGPLAARCDEILDALLSERHVA